MSYLDVPRLTFFGQFTANPSTSNNDPGNYSMTAPMDTSQSWNPCGRHNFSFNNCQVTSIATASGLTLAGHGTDPILGAALTTGSAVLVDLDPDQQLVSQIFGLSVSIALSGTATIQGTMQPVNFFDINFGRLQGAGGDSAASAFYMSVLENVTWTGDLNSPFATALQQATTGNMLSIHFVVDGFQADPQNPNSRMGRVVGTIGPYLAGEPKTFVNARMLRPTGNVPNITPTPPGSVSFNMVPAKTDSVRKKMIFDFGNAMPTLLTGSTITLQQYTTPLQVAFTNLVEQTVVLGEIDVADATYANTGLIQEFDISQYASDLATAMTFVQQGTGSQMFLAENPSGGYVNVEPYVFRLNPGDPGPVTLYANFFEQPATQQLVSLALTNALPGTSPNAPTFPSSVTTDANGMATFTITGVNPQNPRGPIDGQVYSIGFSWLEDTNPDTNAYISVHGFDGVPIPDNPTWWTDVFPILNQYSQLYPYMQGLIQLNNYQSVTIPQNLTAIVQRLTLPPNDPGLMPITRELSADKLAIILKWVQQGAVPGTQPGSGS